MTQHPHARAEHCGATAADRVARHGGCQLAQQAAHVAAFNLVLHGQSGATAVELGTKTGDRIAAAIH